MGDPFLENYMKQRQENRTKAELEIRKQNHQYFTETAKIASETSDALNSIQSESTSELKAIDLSTKKSELQTRKTAEENANKAKRREVEIRSTTRKIKEEVSAVIAKYESDTQLFQDRINSEREFAINEEHSKREVQKVQAADEIKRIRERQAKKIVEITQRKNKKIEKLQKKEQNWDKIRTQNKNKRDDARNAKKKKKTLKKSSVTEIIPGSDPNHLRVSTGVKSFLSNIFETFCWCFTSEESTNSQPSDNNSPNLDPTRTVTNQPMRRASDDSRTSIIWRNDVWI